MLVLILRLLVVVFLALGALGVGPPPRTAISWAWVGMALWAVVVLFLEHGK